MNIFKNMKLTSSCKSITRNKDLSIYFAYPYFDWKCGSNEDLMDYFVDLFWNGISTTIVSAGTIQRMLQ